MMQYVVLLPLGLINSLIFTGESLATKTLEPNLKTGEIASPLNSFIAGSCGGLLQCVILVPSEVIKCTMQAGTIPGLNVQSTNAFKPTIDTIRHIYKTEGMRGMYKGLVVTCFREIPAIGVYFFSYKNIRSQIHKMQGGTTQTPVSTIATLVSGALAGGISWLLVYPIDVIKTNVQASVSLSVTAGSAGSPGSSGMQVEASKVYKSTGYQGMSFWSVGRALYQKRGFSVFYNGVGAAVFRALPVNAVVFYLYENIKPLI
jgi:solute carrier family 25 (mitochondrial carnitine/acylcarnitine transporter), member 20/29